MIKCADDMMVIEGETSHCDQVITLIVGVSSLHLTKNMRDFRSDKYTHHQIANEGERFEFVDEYRYTGTVIDAKLTWDSNTGNVYSVDSSCIISKNSIENRDRVCYSSFVDSSLTFCFITMNFFLCV